MKVGKGMPEWADDILEYLETKNLPTYREEERKVRSKASQSTMIDGTLYRQGFLTLLLRCISKEEAEYIKRKVHD